MRAAALPETAARASSRSRGRTMRRVREGREVVAMTVSWREVPAAGCGRAVAPWGGFQGVSIDVVAGRCGGNYPGHLGYCGFSTGFAVRKP